MNLLTEAIKRAAERHGSLRAVALGANVSYTGLKNLRDNTTAVPELATLQKLARFLQLPLWRVIEMAGFDLELHSPKTEYEETMIRLKELSEIELEHVNIYIDVLLEQRKRHGRE